MAAEKLYQWNGDLKTAREVHALVPAYSLRWITDALQQGCRSLEDLRKREAEKAARVQKARRTCGNTLRGSMHKDIVCTKSRPKARGE